MTDAEVIVDALLGKSRKPHNNTTYKRVKEMHAEERRLAGVLRELDPAALEGIDPSRTALGFRNYNESYIGLWVALGEGRYEYTTKRRFLELLKRPDFQQAMGRVKKAVQLSGPQA